jgi:hypothetical protein
MASLVSGISVSNGTLVTPAILNANPTLTAGTVVPADLSSGAPSWNSSGDATLAGALTASRLSGGAQAQIFQYALVLG